MEAGWAKVAGWARADGWVTGRLGGWLVDSQPACPTGWVAAGRIPASASLLVQPVRDLFRPDSHENSSKYIDMGCCAHASWPQLLYYG